MFKPLIQKLHEQIQRPPSFAPVYFPNEALPPVAVEAAQPDEAPAADTQSTQADWLDVVGRLYALPHVTATDKSEIEALGAELMPLLERAKQLEHRIRTRRRGEMSEQWEQLRAECRKQLSIVERLRHKERAAEATVESAIAERDHAMTALQAANSARLPAYPTKQEIATREKAINEARTLAQAAERTLSYAIGDRYQAQQELRQAEEKMQELGSAERRLRHELDGKEYFDAEYGLKV